MDNEFWQQRWESGRLGFHQQKVNSRLTKFWNKLQLAHGDTVLVPLCGKSLDMLWLARQGHPVIGIEISNRACRDFYAENELPYTHKDEAQFIKFNSGKFNDSPFNGGAIELWCGDFFNLKPTDMNEVRTVYDRAALIALPESMRTAYVAHLAMILPPHSQVFLISIDYDQTKMKGPPFSVAEHEVHNLFKDQFSTTLITHSSGPDIVGNLSNRGLDTLNEKVYLLRRLAV